MTRRMGPGVPPGRRECWSASPLFRRNIPNPGRMRGEIVQAIGQMHALVRRWTLCDRQPGTPFLCRPDRPRDETAAAVRAYIVQLVLDAVRTERALVSADARFHRMRRKILVAIFAVRPELQRHGRLVMVNASRIIANRTLDANAENPSISAIFPQNYRRNSLSGSFKLSFNRSSTIDERTCATLWCGISTLLTISERLFRSRSTTFSR